MRKVLIVVVLVIAAAVLGMYARGRVHGFNRPAGSENAETGQTRDEIRKSFTLQTGARVEVQGINGKVEVQTSDTKTADVYVLRTANSSDDLARREVIIEQTPDGLLIRAKLARQPGFWDHLKHLFHDNPTEDVTIKAPRQIALSVRGVNGRVTTGDIDGALEAKGINGRVELGQANGSVEISGINGNISVGLNKLSDRGARVSGVNGGIELRIGSGLNADLNASGMNGSVRSEIPDVTIDKEQFGSHYSARIGSGGIPITINGINGNVRLTRAPNSSNSSATTERDSPNQRPSNSVQQKLVRELQP